MLDQSTAYVQAQTLVLQGDWDFKTSARALSQLKNILKDAPPIEAIDFQGVGSLDFVFLMLLYDLLGRRKPRFVNPSTYNTRVLEVVESWVRANPSILKEEHVSRVFKNPLEHLGRGVTSFYNTLLNTFNFCGMVIYFVGLAFIRPKSICWTPLIYHINESGFKVLPVSILTVFVVGFAVALQGAMQLQGMGFPMMSIEMTAKLSLREMGPFILALVVAGRSASSFTAQIGVMKITEELDAMKTMGLNPFAFLVLPRVLALMIAMPLMVFLADVFSILGAMIAIRYQLGVDFAHYIARLHENVGVSHFFIGLIKAPFWGFAIALVGCMRGFEVKGDTESVGKLTTISVVNALFWLIFLDAAFSVIFGKLNV
ncbi:MlaE family lipid ABC transporter permease subunit [Helicobacter heilmannii]|uniref:MlaE family lipid ABC transporter permease subunit n=1 Tax=Helicobacter heilmannii TaxID=35817 RepID=UPI0006A2159C|nr:MlaE family lipid ABC transporter permease subunit [Helicobacter heilmannii]CRF45675.1 ABC-type transport system involved in resistance to organic solvents, permease component [Helicobacter heilmannii]